jgi:phospholipid/cholesterol/gamma-HCH transport system substrate-binding protein
MMFQRIRRTTVLGATVLLVSSCQFGGLNSIDMPGTAGHGAGSYTVAVEMPDVATLPQNSPVMVRDVTVGSVSGIEAVQRPDGTVYAAVRLSLNKDVHLPADATVKLAQTSLLGSQHIELSAPPGEPAVGELGDGSKIELDHAGRYPTTEEVLSSLGVVVNKGNLGALQDITDEAYNAVAGRSGSFADLVPRLAELAASLRQQTNDIISAFEGLHRISAILAHDRDEIGLALEALPGALRVLNANRTNIIDAFGALKSLGEVAARVLSETKEDFAADVKNLYPVVKSLADNSADLVTDFDLIPTFPFATSGLRNVVRGDYVNVVVNFDLTVRRIGESFFTTSPLDPNMKHLNELVNPPDFLMGEMANLSGQAADPFKIPPSTAPRQEAPH